VLIGVAEGRVVVSRSARQLVGGRTLAASLGPGLLGPVLRSLGIAGSVALSLIVHVNHIPFGSPSDSPFRVPGLALVIRTLRG